MNDKQLTGTITLSGVDPELYELTGEVRQANGGEWIYNNGQVVPARMNGSIGWYPILRRKPIKIRVTPTQADLDAAAEPIPCWVKIHGKWNETVLLAIDKFSNGANYYVRLCGWCCVCEIEKEVTE